MRLYPNLSDEDLRKLHGRFLREDIHPPKPKPEKKRRKVIGYAVMYGGSMHQDSKRSSRFYTKDAAERIARRLERRGIGAYISPLTVDGKLRGIRKSKTRRSR